MSLLGVDTCRKVRLVSRNEGRIKAYESCSDVRAWSHDSRVRARYLREWMKGDMPMCVLPVCTLANFFRTMTCRSRSKATPRCHPDCKSKVLLESICSSCHAIKQCLKEEPNFDKYFAEEEFETSHWPCDKCLDVLKSIKMFWKIIVEKIFGLNISKEEEFDNIQDSRTDTVKSVAKIWEREIIQQALFVKNVTPFLSKGSKINKTESSLRQPLVKKETITRIPRPCKLDTAKGSIEKAKTNKVKSPTSSILSQRTRSSDNGRSSCSFNKPSRKLHRCTSNRVSMVDEAIESCNIVNENDDLNTYKKNIEVLQQKCNLQETEIDQLKSENNSLKIELQNFYKSCSWRSSHTISETPNCDKTEVIPKPFESCIDDTKPADSAKNVDSEMIITMKNCRNESFKHVSLLQVLHKTNDPMNNIESASAPYSKRENPLDLLNRVQNTFGEIVRREILLVNNRRFSSKHSDIDASFHKLKKSRSAPSCSTICSESVSSESNFVRL